MRQGEGKIYPIKGQENKRVYILNITGMTPFWCGSLRSECAVHWQEGSSRLGTSIQSPAVSRISEQPLQPWQWRQQGISWAEVVLMVADCIVFALLQSPQEGKSFPRVSVWGVCGQAQSLSVQHS